jgi:aminomethyltransferase
LHGHELGPGITPLQARLDRVVAWGKGDFRGRGALEAERSSGPSRLLWGLLASGRQPPREHADVVKSDARVGYVTSGNYSPVLERGIGLAFLDTTAGIAAGDAVEIEVRGRRIQGRVVEPSFVRNGEAVVDLSESGEGTA